MAKVINHILPVVEIDIEYVNYNRGNHIEQGIFYIYGENTTDKYIEESLQKIMYRNNWRYKRLLSTHKMVAKCSMDVNDYINFKYSRVEEYTEKKERKEHAN